jgi:hypothetical protein
MKCPVVFGKRFPYHEDVSWDGRATLESDPSAPETTGEEAEATVFRLFFVCLFPGPKSGKLRGLGAGPQDSSPGLDLESNQGRGDPAPTEGLIAVAKSNFVLYGTEC